MYKNQYQYQGPYCKTDLSIEEEHLVTISSDHLNNARHITNEVPNVKHCKIFLF